MRITWRWKARMRWRASRSRCDAASCGDGWVWISPNPSGLSQSGAGPNPNTNVEAQALLDDDGNAVFGFFGKSCAAGTSEVIADVEAGTHPTYVTTYTVDPPAVTI